MYKCRPLNALRAFEAAARHLSLTKAAQELNVSPGAVSHQIRALEALLGIELFERRVRAIALTPAAKLLYPGVQNGFLQIQEAVASLRHVANERVLVVSTPPGLTSKWLAARLYRFASGHPEIEVRISSSLANAEFHRPTGVDVAVRNSPPGRADDPGLALSSGGGAVARCRYAVRGCTNSMACRARRKRSPACRSFTMTRWHSRQVADVVEWFSAAGVPFRSMSARAHFNSADHAL
jgi:LysR family glycine cleavage system transcriptional activator